MLRAAAFFGLLVLYLQPHWRSEREEVRNSRVLLLADTSLSMGTVDGQGRRRPAQSLSRSQQLVKALKETDFLAQLRKTHDVVVVPFSEDLQREQMKTLAKQPLDDTTENAPRLQSGGDEKRKKPPAAAPDWGKLLEPTGMETRLGQALRQLIQEERDTPVSGIILFSDGGQNAGIPPEAAVALAQEARIPVYTVGLGSDQQPTNVAVCDLAAPMRAYPGDHYTLTGYLQAQGMAHKVVTVEVLSRAAGSGRGSKATAIGEVIASRQVTLGGDGEVLPVKFDLSIAPPAAARSACKSKRPRATRTSPTIPAKPTSKSSIARLTCCCWPTGRCANTSFSATSSIATATRRSTCCCNRASLACRKRRGRSSAISPPRGRKCPITIASWPSILIGNC